MASRGGAAAAVLGLALASLGCVAAGEEALEGEACLLQTSAASEASKLRLRLAERDAEVAALRGELDALRAAMAKDVSATRRSGMKPTGKAEVLYGPRGETKGSVYVCPDGVTAIPNDGSDCPGALLCAHHACKIGSVHRDTVGNETKCGKFGCQMTCCEIDCRSIDKNSHKCQSSPHCVYDSMQDVCREKVECGLTASDSKKLMMFTSKGLASTASDDLSNVLVPDTTQAFWDLIGALKPEWHLPKFQNWSILRSTEKRLRVLAISDACYVQLTTDKGWHGCESYKTQLEATPFEAGGQPGIGLARGSVFEVALADGAFDAGAADGSRPSEYTQAEDSPLKVLLRHEAADDGVFEDDRVEAAVVRSLSEQRYNASLAVRQIWGLSEDMQTVFGIGQLVEAADVVAINGGNPDWLKAVVTSTEDFRTTLTRRVELGELIFMGRSAGAMVGGKNVALSVEDGSRSMIRGWTGCNPRLMASALKLVGSCTVRPHYTQEAWDVAVTLYERSMGTRAVRIPNGEAMSCMHGTCLMYGLRAATGASDYPAGYVDECIRTGFDSVLQSRSR